MFIGFIGSPRSGKTTIAAKVFAELKESGQPNVEFIAEHARYYIAERLYEIMDGQKITLTDEDQLSIFETQFEMEIVMESAAGKSGIVICDSIALNALLYMSEEARKNMYSSRRWKDVVFPWYQEQALFLATPVNSMSSQDVLRIHNPAESKAIDDKIHKILDSNGTDVPLRHLLDSNPPQVLTGPIDFRVNKVIRRIYEQVAK
jgi:GTPase SAR1 family protein